MENYELALDEIILFEDFVTYNEEKGLLNLILTKNNFRNRKRDKKSSKGEVLNDIFIR